MSEHTWSELVPAYVLDVLDVEDRERFDAHVGSCARCAEDVRSYREAVADLADAVVPATPPPDLGARILERARAERAGPVLVAGPPTSGEAAPRSATAPDATSLASVRHARSYTRVLPWLVAGTGIAASIAFSLGLSRTRGELTRLQQRLDDTGARVTALAADSARADSVVRTVLQSDLRTAFLNRDGAEPELHLFWSPGEARVLMAAFTLPPAAPGRTYQLWGIRAGDDPVSLGTFDTAADGTTLRFINVSRDARFDVSAVTDEPAGGSPQPTTQPFLVGSWSAAAP